MGKPLAMRRVNRSGVEATINQFHTKKAPPFDHHLGPIFHIPATF